VHQLTERQVRYAIINHSNNQLVFGKAKTIHLIDEAHPDRVELVKAFLRRYARALHIPRGPSQKSVIIYYIDESYVHTNHAAGLTWQVRLCLSGCYCDFVSLVFPAAHACLQVAGEAGVATDKGIGTRFNIVACMSADGVLKHGDSSSVRAWPVDKSKDKTDYHNTIDGDWFAQVLLVMFWFFTGHGGHFCVVLCDLCST
jgi:hypothetical protein